jgi:WXG100 family type VII secretion target
MVDVKMNYSSMETMAKEFGSANAQIQEAVQQMKKIAKMMEDGALQGDGGEAFKTAINSKLLPRLNKISEKMKELEQDIRGAVSATRDGVKDAQSRFK